MPSKSPKQHRLMEAVAHNPAFAKKAGIPQSVGQEFVQADKVKSGDKTMKTSHDGHDHGHKHMSHKMMPGEGRKEERIEHYNKGFHEAKQERKEHVKHHLEHRGK